MIKLTEAENDFDFYVNPKHLIWFVRASRIPSEGSVIYTTAGEKETVKESPEEILQLIEYEKLPNFNTVYNTSEYKGK